MILPFAPQETCPMPDNDWIAIRSDQLSARIDPLGAQLSSLRDAADRDLLWDGDPAVWSGRAPLLFPIVGMLAGGCYRLGTREYRLSRHGFARGKRFEVIESGAATAAFRLSADDSTRALYPFEFELETRFAIEGPELCVTTRVRNRGSAGMPASFGYHPALRWPLPYGEPRAQHRIEFETDEPEPIRRLNPDGLLASEAQPTPVMGRELGLADSLFENDVLIFDRIRSRSVRYGASRGPSIRVRYPDTPYLGVWSKPHAPFVCIEPWHGFSDPEGYSGDFSAKPGIFVVPPKSAKTVIMTIALERAR
jgi:galactose mutarotase-like enzyme